MESNFDIHAFAAKYGVKVVTDIKKMTKLDCDCWSYNFASMV